MRSGRWARSLRLCREAGTFRKRAIAPHSSQCRVDSRADMQRESWTWTSERLPVPARVVRWGHFGTPVLLFPTAGGDAEEVERFHLVGALRELMDKGRIKVFAVEGVAARTWLKGSCAPAQCV